jgi:glycosyltransferase involved in cell wall biosynthesis
MKKKTPAPPSEWLETIDNRWQKAKAFFKKRSPVVFMSAERFWEPHGFVQQSLAYTLAREGIEVIWLDGSGWRGYRPVVTSPLKNLSVAPLFQLPLRRFSSLNSLSLKIQARKVKSLLRTGPGRSSFFWLFGGMDEALAAELPGPDVYSVFDNPYSNLPDGGLCQRAKIIACQNTFAQKLYATRLPTKTQLVLPPVELPEIGAQSSAAELPPAFPRQVMGYVGAFFSEGINFSLIEEALIQLPEWGVLLVGRTDRAGEVKLARLGKFSNFHRIPWVARDKALAYWNALEVAFFPYAETMAQDGAFAVKSLEALYFRKPVIATKVPKTADLGALISFAANVRDLRSQLDSATARPPESLSPEFWDLALKMNPKVHLAEIAESFS